MLNGHWISLLCFISLKGYVGFYVCHKYVDMDG
jgi:hypothetical protein